ncbi:hypothetical protein Syn7502_02547 [Synechococcus sp. PCC 7502]|uniref:DUF58 domain-containing protein n=1 Tax=Synechococcus sp. PCC 7502 TaxID=1173263 RepID=UPI00029FE81C|nr:DUF58 domain-containing protein [Synechococcus sp. PCC 7502]AFY74518.1 hypothetical protein Syn7502_02547 [Synechococcus sp. PCC 7502]
MIPTQRLYLLLIAGIAIAAGVAGIFDPEVRLIESLKIVLGFDFTVLAIAFLDARHVKSHRVEVSRQHLSRLSINRDNPVQILVTAAAKPQRNAIVTICDDYPQSFKVSDRLLTASISPNTTQTITYTVRPFSRGEFSWGDMQIRQLGAWGLAWHQWKVISPQKVSVYPDLLALRSLTIKLTLQSTGAMRNKKRFGLGTEFSELREYAIGDDPRLIDWKATARRQRPLIRVLEPEQEQTLIILLDRGRLMTQKVQNLNRFDYGLNATLCLALAGLHRGDRVGIGVFDRQMHTWIPPERGQNQLSKLIERLTPIQPEIIESDYVNAVTTVVNQQSRRALVVVITDIIDGTASSELLSALGKLRSRYLPFCIALRDPQVDVIANAPSSDLQSAYTRSVALDLIGQRQVAFASLQQKGVLVLDAPANQISDLLVDRYLTLKARNQI